MSENEQKEQSKKKEQKEIVINRMFVGNYLISNLGHEIINLFQADNGKHYLYLNAYGNFDDKRKIGTMLMVKSVGGRMVEVIGMAKELVAVDGVDQPYEKYQNNTDNKIYNSQIKLIKDERITYGGVFLNKIFNDAEQQTIFVTFKAEAGKVFIPKDGKRIFIQYVKDNEQSEEDTTKEEQSEEDTTKEEQSEEDKYVVLKGYKFPSTPLKSYICPDGEGKEIKRKDYDKVLKEIVNDDSLWTTERKEGWKVNINDCKSVRKPNLFEICQIQNDENRLSNALAYFMAQPEYKGLWKDFFNTRLEGDNLHDDYTVEREANAKIDNNSNLGGGRIDLLIKDKENIVVIENKIKSGINSKASDKENKTQLDRYVEFGNELKKKLKIKPHYFILAPDYNVPDLSQCKYKDEYHIIKYSELFKFLSNSKYKEFIEKDDNFKAFRDTLFRHKLPTHNDYLFYEMLEKFQNRIINLRNIKKARDITDWVEALIRIIGLRNGGRGRL